MKQRRPRQKDNGHLGFIRSLPCVICLNNTATEAAHIRMADPRFAKPITGAGTKPDDRFVVPLCSECHRQQHGTAERAWWNGKEIDALALAVALYVNTGNYDAGMTIIGAYH